MAALYRQSPVSFLKCLLVSSLCYSCSVSVTYANIYSHANKCAWACLSLAHQSPPPPQHTHKHTCGHGERADTRDAKKTKTTEKKRLPSCFLLLLIPYVRVELNRVLDVWVVFLCPKRLTNRCCPEQKQPLHCLSICAQPYQRFNTYCFKLHQSLPPLPSHSPSSLGSFFSVSFYYFASSSFSPLTSLHIILAVVAFSSSSYSLRSSLTPVAPICFIFILPQSFPSSPACSPPSFFSFLSGSSLLSFSFLAPSSTVSFSSLSFSLSL